MSVQQKPLELIHARNLVSALSTPAFVVDSGGRIVFFNDAAATLLGRHFEETGPISSEDWRAKVGPFDENGDPIDLEELPVTQALRQGIAGYARHELRPAAGGEAREYEITGVPLVSTGGGFRGAIVFFWGARSDEEEGAAE